MADIVIFFLYIGDQDRNTSYLLEDLQLLSACHISHSFQKGRGWKALNARIKPTQ